MQENKFTIENFSDRFSSLVSNSPLSQKQLAEVLGVAESAIVNYKSGRTPKAGELLRIARHFEVSMEWLLTGRDPSPDELYAIAGYTLAANSREAAGASEEVDRPKAELSDEEFDEGLLKRIEIASSFEVQGAIQVVEDTIASLRRQAQVFDGFSTTLLIEAERLETELQSMKTSRNAIARSNTEAIRAVEKKLQEEMNE